MIDLYKKVLNLVIANDKYVSEDNKLLKAKLYEDIIKLNEQLLDILLSDTLVKETFFKKIKDTLVFDKQKFVRFVESKEFLEDSYTSYINKIGLTSNGEFISNSNDVVLDFPFKDCYLYGGQDKDDQKRKEIFYNELIASDEVRQMLAPKVLGNAKRYTKTGVEEVNQFDENDNLIIKGNNLIALASLLKRYEGKVKCIYIDPPYNTGNDSFNYNDKFNHSSWLVFMKNRLELAKRLLRDDGVIWINIDDDEGHYLKVLCDDIFGRFNFINTIIWEKKYSPQNNAKFFSDNHDFILCYAKNKETTKIYHLDRTDEMNARYKNLDDDYRGHWKAGDISIIGIVPQNIYQIMTPSGRKVLPPAGSSWRFSKEQFANLVQDNRIWFGPKGESVPSIKRFISEVKNTLVPKTIWNWSDVGHTQDAKNEIKNLNSDNIFATPKPEKLLWRIISISTKQQDLVVDFCLGSGTTAAVAHKMNRRYIGIEQMDYIQDISVERLKKVIDGEQGGISKSVNWQGEGSFVYCELLENAQQLIKEIQKSDETSILEIKNKVFNDERIIPYLTTNELEQTQKEFDNLSLEDKKKVLIRIIDKNKLYINYSEIDDENYNIDQNDKDFSKSFYKGE
ncbi:site-specific DNA-methyltransferase [Mycoplasma feriruminatoris]|uniref:DNA methyltransferase n=1 Tax=Mycoplasma feriruminatoris TaxID=1179777 RepID=UPI00241CA0B6|nr:site-specific DNA-methyltransferase [Mycoplasma feriruminatoris]WFQ91326.1 site-specific DNA-methyltransferase [Mycoplasma feriruminatoris]